MYDVIAFLKPNADADMGFMREILESNCSSILRDFSLETSDCITTPDPDSLVLRIPEPEASLQIQRVFGEDAATVAGELAEFTTQDIAGTAECYTMSGDDPQMELFNAHLFIIDDLLESNRFVLVDPVDLKEITA